MRLACPPLLLACALGALGSLGAPAAANDTEGEARVAALAKARGSLVRVQARVRVRIERVPGLGNALARTQEISLPGVVADGQGLILFSAAGLDPAGPAYELIGGGGPVAVGEVRVVGADGKIRTATWLGRDPQSGLAAVRVEEASRAGLIPLDLSATPAPLSLGEPIYVAYLSGAALEHAATLEGARVAATSSLGSALTPRLPHAVGAVVLRPDGSLAGFLAAGEVPRDRDALLPGAWAEARAGRVVPLAHLGALAKTPPSEAPIETDAPKARAWIGAKTQALSSENARRLGTDVEVGVYVDEVYEGPASVAGLKAGDVLMRMDGEPLDLEPGERLDDLVADYVVGEEVPFLVRRGGKNQELRVRLAKGPLRPELAPRLIVSEIGLILRELTFFDLRAAKLDAKAQGAVVVEVAPDGAASRAGLRPGDLILEVGGGAISSLEELRRLALADGTQPFKVLRGGETLTLRVRR